MIFIVERLFIKIYKKINEIFSEKKLNFFDGKNKKQKPLNTSFQIKNLIKKGEY